MTLLELRVVLVIFLHEVLLDGSCHEEELLKFALDMDSTVFGLIPSTSIYIESVWPTTVRQSALQQLVRWRLWWSVAGKGEDKI